jgi:hypothetical protein
MSKNYEEIDSIIKENKLFRYRSELEDVSKVNSSINRKRIKILKRIIKKEESIKTDREEREDKLKKHFDIINEQQYIKKWQYLNKEQKLDRFNKFIKKVEIEDDIIDELIEKISNNSLKSKNITYDKNKCMILNILYNKHNFSI